MRKIRDMHEIYKLSDLDKRILEVLYKDARSPVSEISDQIDEPASTIRGRIKRMEAAGVIEAYQPIINPKVLGYLIKAIVIIRRDSGGHVNDISHHLETIPGLTRFQNPLGDVDGLLTIWARDVDELGETIRRINQIEGVLRTETLVLLEEKQFLPPNQIISG